MTSDIMGSVFIYGGCDIRSPNRIFPAHMGYSLCGLDYTTWLHQICTIHRLPCTYLLAFLCQQRRLIGRAIFHSSSSQFIAQSSPDVWDYNMTSVIIIGLVLDILKSGLMGAISSWRRLKAARIRVNDRWGRTSDDVASRCSEEPNRNKFDFAPTKMHPREAISCLRRVVRRILAIVSVDIQPLDHNWYSNISPVSEC